MLDSLQVGLALALVAAATWIGLHSSGVLSQLPELAEADDAPGTLRDVADSPPVLTAAIMPALTAWNAGDSASASMYNTERHIAKAAPGALRHQLGQAAMELP